jgi:hypothetical protein
LLDGIPSTVMSMYKVCHSNLPLSWTSFKMPN